MQKFVKFEGFYILFKKLISIRDLLTKIDSLFFILKHKIHKNDAMRCFLIYLKPKIIIKFLYNKKLIKHNKYTKNILTKF